jgi:ketosteroid isomerase-like protein
MILLLPLLFALADPAPPEAHPQIAAAHAAFARALIAGDAGALAGLYRADAISTPEYQPALLGPAQVEAYWRAIAQRIDVLAYAPVQDEVIDLGDGALVEIGRFTLRWRPRDGAERSEEGKFMAVYRAEAGTLRLLADVRGYFRPLADAALFRVPIVAAPALAAPQDSALDAELAALNRVGAQSVQRYEAEPRIVQYAEDAVYWPVADTPKRGIAAIRAHLVPYTEQSRGVTFDSVRVWNDRATRHGDWALENSRFHVRWHNAEMAREVSGGGLRLWRREADGTLKMVRQMGTHDYRD